MTRQTAKGPWKRAAVRIKVLEMMVADRGQIHDGTPRSVSHRVRQERIALVWALAIIRRRAPEDVTPPAPSNARLTFEKVYGPPIPERGEGR